MFITAEHAVPSLDSVWSIWHSHDNVSSIVKPRNIMFVVLVMCLFNIVLLKSCVWLLLVQNCKKWVLSKFKDNKLLLNHSFISGKTVLSLVEKSAELGLVIIILLSSVYNSNLAFLDVVMVTSFINNNIVAWLLSLTVLFWTLHVSSDKYDFLTGGFDVFPA